MKNNTIWDDTYSVVINLESEKVRRAFMEEQLAALKIPHTFLEATNGRTHDFSKVYDETRAHKHHGASLTLPEKGCALSHRRALEEFLKSNKKYALIMEDDIILDTSFTNRLTALLTGKAKIPWTYIQFNYGPVGLQGIQLWWFLVLKDTTKHTLLQWILLPVKGLASNTLSLLWGIRNTWHTISGTGNIYSITRDQYLAGCYLLTREAAEALVELNTPLTYTADRIQNIARRAKRINHYLYVPRLVRQKRESFSSSINNSHFGKEVISY